MLDADEVHIWTAKLPRSMEKVRAYRALLSREERTRGSQFRFEIDGSAYIAARGVLRSLLARYLERPAAHIEIVPGRYGKPELADGALKFNLSHSRGVGLFAFTLRREIGVDVEWMNPGVDMDSLARRSFSAWEYDQFKAMPGSRQTEAFYACWTRKEAFIKALGKGLSYPLKAFDVSLNPDREARLLRVEGSERKAGQWALRSLSALPEYAAAVVVRGQDWSLSCFTPGNTDQAAICSIV